MSSKPSPENILRGHKAPVHATAFVRRNERLITGDADGFVIVWDLIIMRPRAVWRAHEDAILGVEGWGPDKIITHGRDHKLIVWKVAEADEERMSTVLPLDDASKSRPQPWLLHLVEVNTMNFCPFSSCLLTHSSEELPETELLVAVPNTLASSAIDIYSLPSQQRLHTINPGEQNGMAMCLALLYKADTLVLIAAFENGHALVHVLRDDGDWELTYKGQHHTQPVLSLDVHPDHESFVTSSADSMVVKHPLPLKQQETTQLPDTNQRVIEVEDDDDTLSPEPTSLLSAGFKSSHPAKATSRTVWKPWEYPIEHVNTRHSGQQSLRIRSDGRIFATAGWDTHVRVYSTKTLKELAVLQWHKVGCYAVTFSEVEAVEGNHNTKPQPLLEGISSGTGSMVLNNKPSVKSRRIHHAKTAHWVVAGSKDGKVSLWDIY